MAKICRNGDSFSGTCAAHGVPTAFTGTWAISRPTLHSDGLDVVIVGDTSPTSCGHTAMATMGSVVVTPSVHRVGDAITVLEGGSGQSTTGSLYVEVA